MNDNKKKLIIEWKERYSEIENNRKQDKHEHIRNIQSV